MFSKRFLFLLFFLLVIFTRFIGLTWGNGSYFHPDENNMATAISQFSPQNYNPHFFAYGQFPLYLGYFSLKAIGLPNNFGNSILILRIWSAMYSSLSVLIIYLIGKKLFSKSVNVILVLLIILNPGLIQLAHFGTTESLLILVFLANIFLAIKIIDHPRSYLLYIFAGIVTGIGLATKISSLIFLGPILLAAFAVFVISPHRLTFIPKILLLFIFTLFFSITLSPYSLIAGHDFLSTQKYETGVATGVSKVFYTTQFQNTTPYLFQFVKIFPYVSGLPVFILGIFGFLLLIKNLKAKNLIYWLLILVPSLVYFLYFGQLYTKWTRFVSPVFFLFPLLTVYFLSKIKNIPIRFVLLVFCCLPGIYFMNTYLHPDNRLTASQWINKNIPQNSKILSEGGNVVNLPLGPAPFQVTNYDFYGNYNPATLASDIAASDYILVPSRRVFANYHFSYYQHLFDGSLGFREINQFNPHTDILLNPENAEETYSVFDRPTIRIYRKVKQLDQRQYEKLLQS